MHVGGDSKTASKEWKDTSVNGKPVTRCLHDWLATVKGRQRSCTAMSLARQCENSLHNLVNTCNSLLLKSLRSAYMMVMGLLLTHPYTACLACTRFTLITNSRYYACFGNRKHSKFQQMTVCEEDKQLNVFVIFSLGDYVMEHEE